MGEKHELIRKLESLDEPDVRREGAFEIRELSESAQYAEIESMANNLFCASCLSSEHEPAVKDNVLDTAVTFGREEPEKIPDEFVVDSLKYDDPECHQTAATLLRAWSEDGHEELVRRYSESISDRLEAGCDPSTQRDLALALARVV